MENTMKNNKVKKVVATIAASVFFLGVIATTNLATANAQVYRIKADFRHSFENTYDWCKTWYKPSPAQGQVKIYMSPGQTASATVRVTGPTETNTRKFSFKAVDKADWVDTAKVSIHDAYATSLNLAGTRFYNNGTNMQYDVYYYE